MGHFKKKGLMFLQTVKLPSDLDLSLQGLHDHFGYIEQYKK